MCSVIFLLTQGGFFVSKRRRTEANKEAEQRYDEKRAGQRTRNWTTIFYPEDLPDDWIEQLNNLHFKWVQSPLHDQDVNPDGKPKKVHYHVLLLFDVVKTEKQITDMLKEIYGESESGSIIGVAKPEKVTDRGALVRYFAHMDNPEKAQYDIADIVGHNGADPAELLRFSATETREMIIAMEEYIEKNHIIELSDFSAAIRYEYPEWHTLLCTKMTLYFTAFIRSCRHKVLKCIDPKTGEYLDEVER